MAYDALDWLLKKEGIPMVMYTQIGILLLQPVDAGWGRDCDIC